MGLSSEWVCVNAYVTEASCDSDDSGCELAEDDTCVSVVHVGRGGVQKVPEEDGVDLVRSGTNMCSCESSIDVEHVDVCSSMSIVPHMLRFAVDVTRQVSDKVGPGWDLKYLDTASEFGRGIGNPTCSILVGLLHVPIGTEVDLTSVGTVCHSRLDDDTTNNRTEWIGSFMDVPDSVTGNALHSDVTRTDGIATYDRPTWYSSDMACFGGSAVASISWHMSDKNMLNTCCESLCRVESAVVRCSFREMPGRQVGIEAALDTSTSCKCDELPVDMVVEREDIIEPWDGAIVNRSPADYFEHAVGITITGLGLPGL